MNYLSVCSGIEAASVSWEPLGWKCVGVSEIEPFPCAVLNHHFPTVPNFGDMTKFKEWKINGTVDLLAGGPPCQSFSVAGLRQGLKDPRGNLTITYLSLVEHFKPKWIVFENVPGLLSSNGGKDFGSFLGGLAELGYGFAYRVLDAQWVRTHRHPRAVPQRRRRVFVVGCAGDHISAAKVLFKSESLQRYSAPRRATRQGTAADVAGCLRSGGDGVVPSSRGEHLVFNESSFAKFRESDIAMPPTVSDGSVSTGDGSVVGCLSACMEKQVSNQMVYANQLVPCFWNEETVLPTLTVSNAGGNQRMPDIGNFNGVLQPVEMAVFTKSKRAQSKTDNETWVEGVVAPTQNAFDVGDVRATTVAFSIREDATNNTFSATPTNVALTVNSLRPSPQSHHAQIFIAEPDEVSKQLDAPTMQVRRLTPTECERLQGFPDGWTLIPWKKKPADQCPDGPRYKALGNSMAVNCMEWLGERIQAVESGSL